jgi:ABC-2 type transport system ATP-binding protein
VRLCGLDLLEEKESARRLLGYMPDLAPVPSDLKAVEFLELFAHSYGIGNARQRRDRVAECLDEVHLTDKRDSWCRALSRGQTQRLVLAKTLLHRPKVMVLDEPASGMDPLSRRELRLTLRRMADQGVAVIVSSHILSELADMCSSLCVMNAGKILAAGPVEEVRAQLGNQRRGIVLIVLPATADTAEAVLRRAENVSELVRQSERLSFFFSGTEEAQAALVGNLVREGVGVRTVEEQKSSFEDILVRVAEETRKAS